MKRLLCILALIIGTQALGNSDGFVVPVQQVRNDYSGTNVTTGAWVQLVASTTNEVRAMHIFDSSGQTLQLGVGAAGSEVAILTITPGGNDWVPVQVKKNSRVSVKAISGTASSGELDLSMFY